MSLTLGHQGGIAQPLKKRTVGQTNIAHVYDGANHIWPTSVIHFSDFTSVQFNMIPVTQFILGNSDPLLYPSEKMTNSIDEQIAFLQSQKQAINEAYRRNAIPNANNGTTQNQQVPTQGIWDAIDAEIAPLTQEQQNMLLNNQDYVNNYNALQSLVWTNLLM